MAAHKLHLLAGGLLFILSLQITSPSTQAATLPRRGDLGVVVSAQPDAGVRVTQVRAGSAAAQAGIAVGDIILNIDGVSLRGDEGEIAVDRIRTGEVTLTLRRESAEQVKRINVPELPREKFLNADVILHVVEGAHGQLLHTIITRPRTSGMLPAVFVVGWLSCDSVEYPYGAGNDGFGIFLTRLAEQSGFVIVRMDKPGVGDSQGVCSKADFDEELAGYKAAFASLRKHDFIDQQRIFILGLSNGGGVAPLVVPNGSAVKGYVSVSGWGRSWFEHMIEHERRRLTLKGASPAEVTRQLKLFEKFYSLYLIDRMNPGEAIAQDTALKEIWYDGSDTQYGRPAAFYQQLQALNLAQEWSRVDAPVLVIHGRQDWVMSHADAEAIAESVNRLHPSAAQFIELPQANHGMMDHTAIEDQFQHKPGTFHDAVVPLVIQWMQGHAR